MGADERDIEADDGRGGGMDIEMPEDETNDTAGFAEWRICGGHRRGWMRAEHRGSKIVEGCDTTSIISTCHFHILHGQVYINDKLYYNYSLPTINATNTGSIILCLTGTYIGSVTWA